MKVAQLQERTVTNMASVNCTASHLLHTISTHNRKTNPELRGEDVDPHLLMRIMTK